MMNTTTNTIAIETMTKAEIREMLEVTFGEVMSNTVFKATKIADLRAMLAKADFEASEVIEEVEVEIELGSAIPNPVTPVVIPVAEVKEETIAPKVEEPTKAMPKYFQHIKTLEVYRWVKNVEKPKNVLVVFATQDKKEHVVSQAMAKKLYVPVTAAFVKELIATGKKVAPAKKIDPNAVTCEVNVKDVNGKKEYTVTGLTTGRTVKAREGKSMADLIKGYEVEINGLKAKVKFVPNEPDTKTPVAPF